MSEDRQYMGTAANAKAALIEKAKAWRETRQPSMDTAAGHRERDSVGRELRFQLANATLLWLWHEENPDQSARPPLLVDREAVARIVNPGAFEPRYIEMYPDRSTLEGFEAYQKADAILSFVNPQDKGAELINGNCHPTDPHCTFPKCDCDRASPALSGTTAERGAATLDAVEKLFIERLRQLSDAGCQNFSGNQVIGLLRFAMQEVENSPAALSVSATAGRENVALPRWWVEQIRDQLVAMGQLPSGHLGDYVFLLREQLTDALEKRALSGFHP